MKIQYLSINDLTLARSVVIAEKLSNFIDLTLLRKHIRSDTLLVIIDFDEKFYNSNHIYFNKFTKVRKFSWNEFEYKKRIKSHDQAYHSVEDCFSYLIDQNLIPRRKFINLYKSSDIDLFYKKELINKFQSYFNVLNIYLLIKKETKKTAIFPSNTWLQINSLIKSTSINKDVYNNLHNINSILTSGQKLFYKLLSFIKKIIYSIIILVFPVWLITKVRLFIKKQPIPDPVLGIRVYNNGFKLEENSIKVDWIIDNKKFTKNNTIFIAEDRLDEKSLNQFKEHRYTLNDLSIKSFKYSLSLKNAFIEIIRLIILLPTLVFHTFNSPSFLKHTIIVLMINYYRWRALVSLNIPKNYLCYHNYQSDHILRNIILKQYGCKVFMYKHTNSESVFDQHQEWKNTIYAFLNYDIEFHWTESSIKMAKSNSTQSKELINVGPIWSSLIQKNSYVEKTIKAKWADYNNSVIISAFTSSLGENVVNPYDAHELFLKYLFSIISNDEKVKVILKSKYPFHNYLHCKNSKVKEISNALFSHDQFLSIDSHIAASYVMYYSDINVSMPFSSTGIEAIYNHNKSFYYDTLNLFPNSVYSSIPYFVASNKTNAINCFGYWMKKDKTFMDLFVKKYFNTSSNYTTPFDTIRKNIIL